MIRRQVSDFENALRVLETIDKMGMATRSEIVKEGKVHLGIVTEFVDMMSAGQVPMLKTVRSKYRGSIYALTNHGKATMKTIHEWEGILWTRAVKE